MTDHWREQAQRSLVNRHGPMPRFVKFRDGYRDYPRITAWQGSFRNHSVPARPDAKRLFVTPITFAGVILGYDDYEE
jgi:hypothetical protein